MYKTVWAKYLPIIRIVLKRALTAEQILALNKSEESGTEEGAAKANSIVEKISKEEEGYDKDFHNAQEEFARKNKMKLIENTVQKELKNSN